MEEGDCETVELADKEAVLNMPLEEASVRGSMANANDVAVETVGEWASELDSLAARLSELALRSDMRRASALGTAEAESVELPADVLERGLVRLTRVEGAASPSKHGLEQAVEDTLRPSGLTPSLQQVPLLA